MIRILKGNHRKAYFIVIAEILHDGRGKLCMKANNNCNTCKFADVCDSLMSAEEYCRRISRQLKS